jgi:hypothetical protein
MARIGGWVVVLLVMALGAAKPAVAQPSPASAPLAASIFFLNPPANQMFGVGSPIGIAIQLRNISGGPVNTADGFLETEFWRQLYFIDAGANLVTSTGQAAPHAGSLACLSRGGRLEPVTAIPVLPLEILAADYATEFRVDDVRTFYELSRPGRYSVNARIALTTFNANDPSAFITNCDQFARPDGTFQTVVNVGTDTGGRQSFTIVSNSLTFCIGYCTFGEFATPLKSDASCAKAPCQTFRLGSTVPVKFQLLDANGTPFGGAVAKIGVVQLKGVAPPATPIDLGTGAAHTGNLFRYDATTQQYIFNLSTKVLSAGTWQINVTLDSGAIQSVQIGLR